MSKYIIISFYKFVEISTPANLKSKILDKCKELKILGTVILAHEGINGSLAGTQAAIYEITQFLQKLTNSDAHDTHADTLFSDIEFKYSSTDILPFKKLKVLVKKEIVTFSYQRFSHPSTGIQVSPSDWNALIQDPNVLLLDTRNNFEVELGSFEGAINPKTKKFSDFKKYVEEQLDPKQHKNIAMFCTGGIRCEKASAYLLEKGFNNVYQLQGGIIKYLDQTPKRNSLWQGECFVFDNRISVKNADN